MTDHTIAKNELVCTLGLGDLILLIIGLVIGSGIFLVPGEVLSRVGGRLALALMVWLAGGLLSLFGALTYGELSASNPKAGGIYVYIRDCFGPFLAFLFGWSLFFAISGASIATLAVAFSDNIDQVIPMSPLSSKLISVAMITVVTVINVLGTRQSADLQNWTTAIKLGTILAMSVALLWFGHTAPGAGGQVSSAGTDRPSASGFGLAMVGVLWAYEGWQYATFSAGETIEPQRSYPRAFLIGTAALIGIYLLANVAYFTALEPNEVMHSKGVAAAAVAATIGSAAAKLVAVVVAISIFSATNATALTAPRVYYAMAADGVFFRRLASVHTRFRTPAFAVIAGSAWATILALAGTFQQLLTYVIFSSWIFYALGAASIFVYRKRCLGAELPYRVPGYPWTPLLFIIAAFALVINIIVTQLTEQPSRTLLALCVILLGAPAYLLWRSRQRQNLNPNAAAFSQTDEIV
jgi:APA family basic amino acid/polyamine antiporter